MQEFRADIIAVNKEGRTTFLIATVLLAGALVALMVLGWIPVPAQMLGLITFAFMGLRYVLQTKKQVLKKKIGELVIGDKHIVLHGRPVSMESVRHICIDVTGWRSYHRSADRSRPIEGMHTGDKNFIVITTDYTIEKCEFLLDCREQFQQLREYVISWYRNNVPLTETVQGAKSYGLEVLMYAEIQNFKKLISNPRTT